jgi:tricorn protease
VIGTSSTQLIDGSTFRIPRTGVFTLDGVDMEKQGVVPDVLVVPNPDQLAKGIDLQLDKAVQVVQEDVIAWKKTRATSVSSRSEGDKPASSAVKP